MLFLGKMAFETFADALLEERKLDKMSKLMDIAHANEHQAQLWLVCEIHIGLVRNRKYISA